MENKELSMEELRKMFAKDDLELAELKNKSEEFKRKHPIRKEVKESRSWFGRKSNVAVPSLKPRPPLKENLSYTELMTLERARTEYLLRKAARDSQTPKPETVQNKQVQKKSADKKNETPTLGIADLQEEFNETDALLRRAKELSLSQRRILNELATTPLEEQCDSVYADIGKKLYALELEELAEDEEAGRFLDKDEQGEAAEETLEKSGKPPPLRSVK